MVHLVATLPDVSSAVMVHSVFIILLSLRRRRKLLVLDLDKLDYSTAYSADVSSMRIPNLF